MYYLRKKYLKNLYGLGGATYTVKGSGIGYESSSKGLLLYRGYFENRAEKLLKWNYLAERISFLIKEDKVFFSPYEAIPTSMYKNTQDLPLRKLSHNLHHKFPEKYL